MPGRVNKVIKFSSIQTFKQMSTLELIITTFITEHELDEAIQEPLIDLVNKCMEGLFKHVYSEEIPDWAGKVSTGGKTQKVLKADKIEDPTLCEKQEDLRNCTTGVLNQFCKDNLLKIGGNKKELMDRVWRHLQGTSSEDDKSKRNAPKKEKKTAEKHLCSGFNIKGEECGVAGTEESGGHHFCWRHITSADEFIEKRTNPPAEDPVKVAKAAAKAAAKALKDAKAATSKPAKAKSAKPVKKAELESEASDDDEEPIVKAKPAAKPAAKAVKVPTKPASKPPPPPSPPASDDESEEEEEEIDPGFESEGL